RFFAYFAVTSSEPAMLAELIAAALNQVAILWRTAPASTELEAVVLDWVAQLVGLPRAWHGHIEDTASTSTLAALIVARHVTGRDAGAWLHVDAAYAGGAMVCPELRWAFEGVEMADSLVINAHKWLFTPVDCSLLWTRRPHDFRDAFSLVPEYLRTPDSEDALSLSEYGPALGRRFRSLK